MPNAMTLKLRQYLASPQHDPDSFFSERDIAEKFKVNRSHSRKMLMSLEGEGLLQCVPQKGYRLVDYSHTKARTMYKYRAAVEAEAARLIIEQGEREDVIRLIVIVDDAAKAIAANDVPAFRKLDVEFHHALIQGSRDALTQKVYNLLFVQTRKSAKAYTPTWMEEAHRAHGAILRAIRDRDGDAAEAHVFEHLRPKQHDEALVVVDENVDDSRD